MTATRSGHSRRQHEIATVGQAGIAAAGLSVVLAVVGLLTRRPGREPVDPAVLLDRILNTGDVTLTEDVLLYADVAVAKRNDVRLQQKAVAVTVAAVTLTAAIGLIVIATMILAA